MPSTLTAARWSECFALSCFIFLSVSFPSFGTPVNKRLVFAVVLFRHGDRSPDGTYPNDVRTEDSWPDGFGQLTQLGIEQQFELGKYLRERYSGLLNSTYNRQEVFVRSTDIDRTIMSAQANLAGFFPPTGRQRWNQNITWQPIPVHTIPLSKDNMLLMSTESCPRFGQLINETVESKIFNELKKPYVDFLKTLVNVTGYSFEELNGKKGPNMWSQIYDTLFCKKVHNYTVPNWATDTVMEKLLRLSEISIDSYFGVYKQQEKSRLMGGVLVKDFLESVKNVLASTNQQKLIMYSAHGITIAGLHAALNVSNGKIPPYASCHFFELYQIDNENFTIEMYFRNDSTVDPYQLTLPGCSQSCPLDRFTDLTSSVIAQDWRKECGLESEDKTLGNASGLTVAVVILSIILFSLVAMLIFRKKRLLRTIYETL